MSKKKVFLTVLAFALVCALSITGTLAYLTATSNNVTNTFVAEADGKLIDTDPENPGTPGKFEIVEAPVLPDGNGNYVENTSSGAQTTTSGLDYKIVPGSKLSKKASINVIGKTTIPAYLYLEVTENLDEAIYSYEVDGTVWTKIDGLTGNNGGQIYYYTAGPIAADTDDNENFKNINILKDDGQGYNIKVDGEVTASTLATLTDNNMAFYGYLAQASSGTGDSESAKAESAFNTCFKASASSNASN